MMTVAEQTWPELVPGAVQNHCSLPLDSAASDGLVGSDFGQRASLGLGHPAAAAGQH